MRRCFLGHVAAIIGVLIVFVVVDRGGADQQSATLLSLCDSDAECAPINATCVKVAETCGRGVCTCVEPFVATPAGHCRRGVLPWRQCHAQMGDVCIGKNFQCIDGQCQCRPGLFPVSEACVQMAQMVASLGSSCSDDSNCLPNMQCRPWVSASSSEQEDDDVAVRICQCPQTHRVLNNTQCVPRRLGDPCGGSDGDCGLILDAVCSPDTLACSCPPSHQATQTLLNTALSVVEGYASGWRLVDACRPLNGATKNVGQRCTNSLQCQFGHMCARCEPKNLNAPKTCNRPACTSPICRNKTCPLCPKLEPTDAANTSTMPPSTSTTTTSTSTSLPATFAIEVLEPQLGLDASGENVFFPLSFMSSAPSQQSDDFSTTTTTNRPQIQEFFTQPAEVKVEVVEKQEEGGVNVALAVTLPLLFLCLCLGGMAVFVRYAWGKLNWRQAVKCVEALETASSSASSGSSSTNRHYGGGTTISELPLAPSTPFGMQNCSYYGSEGAAFTQASATLLIRQEEPTLDEIVTTSHDDPNSGNNGCSALTMNYNTATLDYRRHQDLMHQFFSSQQQQQQPQQPDHRDIHQPSSGDCSRHKYCFNSNYAMDDMVSGSGPLSEAPPRLPLRSKSVRSFSTHNHLNGGRLMSGVGSSFMTSRLEIDRRKPLQY